MTDGGRRAEWPRDEGLRSSEPVLCSLEHMAVNLLRRSAQCPQPHSSSSHLPPTPCRRPQGRVLFRAVFSCTLPSPGLTATTRLPPPWQPLSPPAPKWFSAPPTSVLPPPPAWAVSLGAAPASPFNMLSPYPPFPLPSSTPIWSPRDRITPQSQSPSPPSLHV